MGYTLTTKDKVSLDQGDWKFVPIAVTATDGAKQAISSERAATLLSRHFCGDWGDICDEDRGANESALANGQRLVSVYKSPDHETIWIITEWDRSVTTILLPDEY